MSLYKCVSCNEQIQHTKPRLSCATCMPRMTLCANCYVVQNYSPQHQNDDSHLISLHPHSGFLPVPPPPPPRAQSTRGPSYGPPRSQSVRSPSGPPRRRPISASYSEVPPRKPPRPTMSPEVRDEIEEETAHTVPVAPATQDTPVVPPSPQPVSHEEPRNTAPPPPQYPTTAWAPLLTQDMKPSPSFIRLIEELFQHLDPQRTGLISPEAYSDYLDACGAPPNHNIWRASCARNPNTGYDMADRELTDHFTAYSADFALRPRTPPSTPVKSPLDPLSYLPQAQRDAMSRFMPSQSAARSLSGGQKPMLTFRGWTDLTVLSVCLNPSAAWGQINRAIQTFRIPIWTEWGDIPRDMLPLAPYQPEVERVRVMLEGARLNAEQEIDAVHARLKLEQQGRQNALDLLDDRRWVYRY
ncbi:hypothetical protein BJY04DRAFT_215416 [Aspergillus karnatakaensis]|uniref:uncharacterized protein n=1 Tax=Aspergillus karnatakaensis TaxID=1810916 RepID=UPI003CCDCEF6